MAVTYHNDLLQGSAAWIKARCGLLTASEMKLIVTPTLKAASNEKERAHLYALLGQRIAGYSEDGFQGDDMFRGHEDEVDAKIAYQANYAPIEECGFITNNGFVTGDGECFTIGCSPDALVGDDGMIEVKSRLHKFQVQTILEAASHGKIPDDFVVQVQTALLVSERSWCDFISYSAGLPMVTVRVYPDEEVQKAIIDAATGFEERLSKRFDEFTKALTSGLRLLKTERRQEREITI